MRVMTTGAGKGPFWSAWVLDALDRMSAHRMAFDHILERGVATNTEFVDRLIKLEAVLCGVGAVAGNTAAAFDNAMDVVGGAVIGEQVFFVYVTGDTDIILALCPQLT